MASWAHASQSPNGISIGSTVLAGITNVNNSHGETNIHTDRQRYFVCSNRPHPAIAAMRFVSTADAAYCYRRSSVVCLRVCLSVCLSVGHVRKTC